MNPTEILRKAEEILENHPLPFTAVFMSEGKKFVLGRKGKQKVFIEPLVGISSLLSSRAMFTQLQKNTLTRVRGLNHNLRGPLSGIRSRLELLTRKLDESPETIQNDTVQIPASKIKDIFQKILQSADSLQKQLSDFEQVLSWLDPEQDTRILLPGQVLETIREYLLTDLFVKRNVQVILQPQPPVRSITIHPTLFVEPVLRILDNAVESLRVQNGGTIHITVSSSGSDCILEIRNDGPKLPEKILETSPYDPGVGSFNDGLGMGLSFSKWLIETSGGELTLLENEESGVNFRLRYPRRP
ncbi:MAG: HAMP domain-containing histidine kinase [Holophagae bacterium]|nr:HAMP domain-containing histidine kinase [Holophagae bacterium]